MKNLIKSRKLWVPAVSVLTVIPALVAMLSKSDADSNLFQAAFLQAEDVGEKVLPYAYVMPVSLFSVILVSTFSIIIALFRKGSSLVMTTAIYQKICQETGKTYYETTIYAYKPKASDPEKDYDKSCYYEGLCHFRNITPIDGKGNPTCPYCHKVHA